MRREAADASGARVREFGEMGGQRVNRAGPPRLYWSLNIAIAVSPLLMATLLDFVAPLAGLQLTE